MGGESSRQKSSRDSESTNKLLLLDFTFSKLMSVNNELEGYPPGLDDDGDDKQVNITQYGFGVRFLPHPSCGPSFAPLFRFRLNSALCNRERFSPKGSLGSTAV